MEGGFPLAKEIVRQMFPSCGWSQSSFVVGIGPMFKRSMFVASVSWRAQFLSFVNRRRQLVAQCLAFRRERP